MARMSRTPIPHRTASRFARPAPSPYRVGKGIDHGMATRRNLRVTAGQSSGWRRLLFAPIALLALAATAPDRGDVRYVTDGDTFRLTSGERVRIAGIDAPETHADQAKCHAEIVQGKAAAARLRTLIDGRTVRLVKVGRSYNRTVARVTVDGRDLAGQLVSLGAARWWPRGVRKPDWCPAGGR
jgi:endonuclease YncB( thermonuclease family)